MSAKQRIGRLQELLERVQMRAQEPRASGAAYAPAPVMAQAPASPSYPTPPPALLSPPPAASVPPAAEPQHASYVSYVSSAPPPTEAHAGPEDDADVEVSSETVEIDIDIDEPMPMESGAQPVAQATMPPDDLEDEEVEPPMATQPSVRPPHQDEEVTQMVAPPANEIEEPAPSSSRRPIAAEEPAETYGEESAPRHTPPPESGKQVAAPSVHPSARQSAPPPSLENHTLIGGWREPGLGVPQIAPNARLPASRSEQPPKAGPQASGTRLSPDVTLPNLAVGAANVASFEGAPVAKPTTLGELLDLTLSL